MRAYASILIDFARPFTLIVPALGVAVGGLVAWKAIALGGATAVQQELPNWLVIALGACAAALLNAGSNTINQIYDRRIDAISKPSRPIPSGRISLRAAHGITLAFYLAAFCALIAAGQMDNLPVLGIFGAAALATLIYSVPPLRTRRFPLLANITIAIPRGFLLLVAGYALLADPLITLEPWLLAAAPGFYLLGASSTKDFADMAGDSADGVRSLPLILGEARAIKVISPFLVLPFAGFALLMLGQMAGLWWLDLAGAEPVLAGLAIFNALWGTRIARMLLRDPHALSTSENHPAWKHMYGLMMLWYAGVAIAYAVT